ncbi:MAG: DUF1285 domain-containing protein [Gammaproteobacteria bacterium]|jgi:hypothetical protein|nr:DUF1285 domain-containing protein [Gammaproteobacteria bacterium]MBU1491049.1 DUF1285 domain-containing protein [Gammaproteobacteria bacterium]MBU2138262.1 DUF1285 domain-containing protein [Gammaproteobacteria bacterium]MBU2216636.1 DUF1285 domain-containing protein [Gammaproteobacteria bacterium]MBU2322876.1 DUF1285 domain-containing protein [Gammaproteobacteria bacterium]
MSSTGKASDLLAQIPRSGKGLPPVHLWNPRFCGHIDMRIARDGTWYYLGTPIGRKAMVKLFSSIIRRDGDDYVLVTPVEMVGIQVDDAPFVAVALEVLGEGEQQLLRFTSNVDEVFDAGADHPLRVESLPDSDEPAPYIRARNNLDALIHRNVFYQLVDLAVPQVLDDGRRWLGVWSSGQFFPIGPEPE